MSAMREKDSADYDLERFVELFDEALTSDDPRVKNALRQLMMMVILTSNEPEDRVQVRSHREGPLRRMQEDLRDISTKMHMFDEQIRRMEYTIRSFNTAYGQAINGPGINTNAIAAKEYWEQRKMYDAQISDDELRGLNINKISSGLFGEK